MKLVILRKHSRVCEYELIHIISLDGPANGTKIKNKFIVMTQSNTIAAKASVAFVALAMSLMMIAPAQAATASEMQAQIDALMATIKSLQAAMGTTPAAPTSAYVFTRSLTLGSKGADVTALQMYLIAGGHAIPAGATGYFGAQTAAAVAAWQTANGIMPAAGYFGPVSQAKYAALMAAVVVTPTPTPTPGTTTGDLKGGEASLSNFKANSGDDSNVAEGDSASIAEFKFDVDDADVKISRIDLTLEKSAVVVGDETKPWKTFSNIKLMADGKEIASEDVSNKADWLDDTSPVYVFRFADLNYVVREGDTAVITVEAEAASSVDGTNSGDIAWKASIAGNTTSGGVRGVDGDGLDQSIGLTAGTVSFDVTASGGDDELKIVSASSNPEATTLQLKNNATVKSIKVFSFDLDTKNSGNDIQVNTLTAKVNLAIGSAVATGTYAAIVRDAHLMVDGKEIGNVTLGGTPFAQTLAFDFDTDEFKINSGDRQTVDLVLDFNQLAAANEGMTIMGSVSNVGLTAEGSDDIASAKLTGSATGKVHTLRSQGAILKAGAKVAATKDAAGNASTNDDVGSFTLKFDVTAFNTDLYINKTAASSTLTTSGAVFRMTNGSGALVGTTSPSGSLSSTADSEVGTDSVSRFHVAQGDTKTFTVTVTFNPGLAGPAFYGVQLYGFNFRTVNDATAQPTATQQRALPASDYETDPLSI